MKIVMLLCTFVVALVSTVANAENTANTANSLVVGGVEFTAKKVDQKKAAKTTKPKTSAKKGKNKGAKPKPPKAKKLVLTKKSAGEVALGAEKARLEAERVAKLEKDLQEARRLAEEADRRATAAETARAGQEAAVLKVNKENAAREVKRLAEEAMNYHVPYAEMGVRTTSVGVSGSPIPIGVKPRTGYSASWIGSTGFKNVDYTLGFARQLYEFSLEGVALGSILSTTLEAGARYNFTLSDKRIVPFVGAGLYNTKFDGHTLLGSTLKVNGISVSGVVVEAGARYMFNERFYVGASCQQYFGETGYNRLMTNFGSAQLTMYNLSNAWSLVLSAGGNFD